MIVERYSYKVLCEFAIMYTDFFIFASYTFLSITLLASLRGEALIHTQSCYAGRLLSPINLESKSTLRSVLPANEAKLLVNLAAISHIHLRVVSNNLRNMGRSSTQQNVTSQAATSNSTTANGTRTRSAYWLRSRSTVWFCHHCFHGPYTIGAQESCTNFVADGRQCDHRMCYHCRVEEV